MFLHSIHGNEDFEPLTPSRLAQVFISANHYAPALSSPQRPPDSECLHAELNPANPRLRTGDGELSIPLRLTQAQLGRDRQSQCPLIALQTVGGNIWLVLFVDMPQALQAMQDFGELGTIRSDFHNLYELHESPLGTGSFGLVYAADLLAEGRALKEVRAGERRIVAKVDKSLERPAEPSECSAARRKMFLREASALASVQGHPNVVGFRGLFEVAGMGCLILTMEQCAGGDLHSAAAAQPFSESRARQMLAGLCAALAHVHGRHVVHRDVKPENILLTGDGRPVLADFGLAAHITDTHALAKRCGTPGYLAPEVVNSEPCGYKADCFSAGCVLHFLLCGSHPYAASTMNEILWKTAQLEVNLERAEFAGVSECCKDLILKLVEKNADGRLSTNEALVHPWIAQEGAGAAQQGHGQERERPRGARRRALFRLPSMGACGQRPEGKQGGRHLGWGQTFGQRRAGKGPSRPRSGSAKLAAAGEGARAVVGALTGRSARRSWSMRGHCKILPSGPEDTHSKDYQTSLRDKVSSSRGGALARLRRTLPFLSSSRTKAPAKATAN